MSPRISRQDVVAELLRNSPNTPKDGGSAFAPANIALCKYWGKRDAELNLPMNSSVSISLGTLGTNTQITPAAQDRIVLNGAPVPSESVFFVRLFEFLDLVRRPEETFLVETENSIPTAAGLASSASGFAAAVMALDDLYGWQLPATHLSILARMGSGSACRSIFEGFVLWNKGEADDGMDSHAQRIPTTWPDLRIGLLILQAEKKPVSSTDGMNRTVATSTLYRSWPIQAKENLAVMMAAIEDHDFNELGETAERNALAMHATMFAAKPPIIYWQPDTIQTIHRVHDLRKNGMNLYLTMDAGPNVKLLFMKNDEDAVKAAFPNLTVCTPFDES